MGEVVAGTGDSRGRHAPSQVSKRFELCDGVPGRQGRSRACASVPCPADDAGVCRRLVSVAPANRRATARRRGRRAAIGAWVEKTWGGWRSPRPYKRIARTFQATTAREQALGDRVLINALALDPSLVQNLGTLEELRAAGGLLYALTPEQRAWWQRLRGAADTARGHGDAGPAMGLCGGGVVATGPWPGG